MILLQATFRVHADRIDDFVAAYHAMRTPTLAEPANRAYELWRGVDDATTFVVIEQWDSVEGLVEHLGAEHTHAASAALSVCLAAEPDVITFNSDDPRSLPDLLGG